MSADRGEPDPQEWPTYPGVPTEPGQPPAQPQQRTPPPADPRSRPYSEPDSAADEAYQAYQDYAQGRPDLQHQQVQPYHQAPYQQRPRDQHSAWLQNKWMWIVGGILAVFMITALAQGNFPWVPIIFGIVVWNIFRHNRRQG